jgi:hypothetical protein
VLRRLCCAVRAFRLLLNAQTLVCGILITRGRCLEGYGPTPTSVCEQHSPRTTRYGDHWATCLVLLGRGGSAGHERLRTPAGRAGQVGTESLVPYREIRKYVTSAMSVVVSSTREVVFQRGARLTKQPEDFRCGAAANIPINRPSSLSRRADNLSLAGGQSAEIEATPPLMPHAAQSRSAAKALRPDRPHHDLQDPPAALTRSRPDSTSPDRTRRSTRPKSDRGDPTPTGTAVGP